ncbi:methionine ABC transporter ATP-binding protein [Corynebacterium sphenisci DSM 44792]|uniref:Methionine ABC transporter ATP-binding protein n=1 Tax=Corynebacterium sphenisci DSM 44792 TaxID=1437874 RepID=A0A1L7CW66_9CORY|nr:methionine ABC transporter permease [Corynebacterium sphenisci]APT90084.1 methionine ABC transporter ATP-binding protein [Corynebacterium sphenisci DSM 44792]
MIDQATTLLAAGTDWAQLRPRMIGAFGETLWMVSLTMLVGGLAGLIMGVALFTTRRSGILPSGPVNTVLNLLVNLVRPIPFIILVTAMGPITKNAVGSTIGTEAAIFVMSVAASFAVARLVEQNLVSVDPGIIEAARAMGASPWRIIRDVIVPEALGPLILGYTFAFIAVVDMSAMAGYIGGGGLGDFAIVYGYRAFDWNVTLVTTLVIVLIVQAAQILGNLLARRVMRR